MQSEHEYWTAERNRLAASGRDPQALAVAEARLQEIGGADKAVAAPAITGDLPTMAAIRRFMARHAPTRMAEAANTAGEPEYTTAGNTAEVRLYGEVVPHMMAGWYLPGEAFSDVGFARVLDGLKGKAITLRINSAGGDVFGGVAIATRVREAKLQVLVEGIAASIASVIVAASPKVSMAAGSTIMVHAPWSITAGNADAHRAEAAILDKIREAMLDIYTSKSGKKYSRAQWRAALAGPEGADGTWWTGSDALAVGIADSYAKDPEEKLPAAKRTALADQRQKVATLYCSQLPAHLANPGKAAAVVSRLNGGRR